MTSVRRVALALTWLSAMAAGCVRAPPPVPQRPAPLAADQVWHAGLRLSCFGEGRRLRSRGLLWLQRPDHFRLHVLGPHGGLIWAVACDGASAALYDAAAGQFRQLPATPSHLAQLLPLAPLQLSAAQWLSLWLGELAPPGAQLQRDAAGQLQQVQMAAADGRPGWQLRLGERGDDGMPRRLTIAVEGGSRCELAVEQGQPIAPVLADLFTMSPPAAAKAP